jgi:hypothetical protein
MSALADNVLFNPTLGGTTDWVVASAAGGYMTPAQASMVNGRSYKYRAESTDLLQWEVGEGTYTSGSVTLSRTTVLFNSSGTTSKINFTTVPIVGVVQLKEDTLSIEEANIFTAAQRLQARRNISAHLKGCLFGLTLSAAGGTATFGIAAGEAADSTSADLMELGSAFTKTTGTWAVGSGSGALDTGAIATSTWYHVYEIKRPDTGVVDVCISLSASAPTTGGAIPSAYTLFRRIGSLLTDGSSQWRKFSQTGDTFSWDVPVADVNGVANSTTASLKTLTVPTGVQVQAFGSAGVSNTDANMIITSPGQTDSAATNNTGQYRNGSTAFVQSPMWPILTNTLAQLRFRQDNATGIYFFNTWGWIDNRGRLF